MYTLAKTIASAAMLCASKSNIGVFATIEAAFEHVRTMEGVTYFFGEIDPDGHDAGDCVAVVAGVMDCYTVERHG